MSFTFKFKTLGSWNSYDWRTQPEMSAHENETTGEVETRIVEGNEKTSLRFSPDSVEEKIKATTFEPLNPQISALAEMMDRLIQSNSAMETTKASSWGTRHQYVSPHSEVPGSSRFPTVVPQASRDTQPTPIKTIFLILLELLFLFSFFYYHCFFIDSIKKSNRKDNKKTAIWLTFSALF